MWCKYNGEKQGGMSCKRDVDEKQSGKRVIWADNTKLELV